TGDTKPSGALLPPGQSYEIRMLDNRKLGELPEINGKLVKSIFRVVFHDRRLQYTEHQQLEGWRWNRPGDRILDIDIPMSVGIIDPRANPTQLNTVEFLWDPAKRTSVFIQPKGADRKQKTDREKMEKRTPHEKEKYQPSYETTILTECSPWPEVTYVPSAPSPGFNSAHSGFSLGDGSGSPSHQPDPPAPLADVSTCPAPLCPCPSANPCAPHLLSQVTCSSPDLSPVSPQTLLPTWSPQEAQQWLHRNRFSTFSRLFRNFSGESCPHLARASPLTWARSPPVPHLGQVTSLQLDQVTSPGPGHLPSPGTGNTGGADFGDNGAGNGADLLKLTREDVIQICGPADGIRLFNALKGRMVRPRLTIYVCQESQQVRDPQHEHEDSDGAGTFFGVSYVSRVSCVSHVSRVRCAHLPRCHTCPPVYHAVYLEELTAAELCQKLALLFRVPALHIQHIYKQGPSGIHVLLSDEMIQNFQDESCFVLDTVKAETNDSYHIILK
ncbi:hypothetical protein Nmel_018939, partial [Mimus melanotis]